MTIEEMIEKARLALGATPEARQQKVKKMLYRLEAERRIRDTCPECGVDTGLYSHTFKCRYRGL